MKKSHLFGLVVLAAGFPALAADLSVLQKDQMFSQAVLKVHVGDTIMWGNADDTTHNITVERANMPNEDLGLQKKGQIIKHSFDAPGDYRIFCKIHPRMKMSVVVE